MAHKNAPKVTPASAEMKYAADITKKAKEYAPMFKEAFPTESALLIALDNAVSWAASIPISARTFVTATVGAYAPSGRTGRGVTATNLQRSP